MENPYIKQYPDLMAGKKILYVHGFGSSARSGTVIRIQSALPNAEVIAYDLPLHPAEAMELLHRVCNEQQPDLIIGTSMGGMYAEMLYGYDRILVNPAFQMGKTMHEHNMMGKQTFQNLRADGVQEFIVTKALVKEYKDITEQCFLMSRPRSSNAYMVSSAMKTPQYIHLTCFAVIIPTQYISTALIGWMTDR